MQRALEDARRERDQAIVGADEAEELLKKHKLELEQLKEEMKNNVSKGKFKNKEA